VSSEDPPSSGGILTRKDKEVPEGFFYKGTTPIGGDFALLT
jgi:hypothetical protein